MTTPTLPVPSAADGVPEATVSGFQIAVHAPVQAGLPLASRFELYKGIPFASTSTLPTPSIDLSATVVFEVLAAFEPELEELPPQAASASAAARAAPGMSNRFMRSPIAEGAPVLLAGGPRGIGIRPRRARAARARRCETRPAG